MKILTSFCNFHFSFKHYNEAATIELLLSLGIKKLINGFYTRLPHITHMPLFPPFFSSFFSRLSFSLHFGYNFCVRINWKFLVVFFLNNNNSNERCCNIVSCFTYMNCRSNRFKCVTKDLIRVNRNMNASNVSLSMAWLM